METVSPTDFPAPGAETPSSMAVERFTEPSLRSFSPTSSIRGTPSDADYTEQQPALNFNSPTPHASPSRNFVDSPLAASTATLVPGDSPKSLPEQPDGGDEYVVVSGTPSERNWGLSSSMVSVASTSAGGAGSGSSSMSPGKAFLGKGRIDARAQDEFIAFMLGKK
jgi:hypothetical protein